MFLFFFLCPHIQSHLWVLNKFYFSKIIWFYLGVHFLPIIFLSPTHIKCSLNKLLFPFLHPLLQIIPASGNISHPSPTLFKTYRWEVGPHISRTIPPFHRSWRNAKLSHQLHTESLIGSMNLNSSENT